MEPTVNTQEVGSPPPVAKAPRKRRGPKLRRLASVATELAAT